MAQYKVGGLEHFQVVKLESSIWQEKYVFQRSSPIRALHHNLCYCFYRRRSCALGH